MRLPSRLGAGTAAGVEIAAFRIGRAAVANALNHAQARRAGGTCEVHPVPEGGTVVASSSRLEKSG